jgi:hypothetical protein
MAWVKKNRLPTELISLQLSQPSQCFTDSLTFFKFHTDTHHCASYTADAMSVETGELSVA